MSISRISKQFKKNLDLAVGILVQILMLQPSNRRAKLQSKQGSFGFQAPGIYVYINTYVYIDKFKYIYIYIKCYIKKYMFIYYISLLT